MFQVCNWHQNFETKNFVYIFLVCEFKIQLRAFFFPIPKSVKILNQYTCFVTFINFLLRSNRVRIEPNRSRQPVFFFPSCQPVSAQPSPALLTSPHLTGPGSTLATFFSCFCFCLPCRANYSEGIRQDRAHSHDEYTLELARLNMDPHRHVCVCVCVGVGARLRRGAHI